MSRGCERPARSAAPAGATPNPTLVTSPRPVTASSMGLPGAPSSLHCERGEEHVGELAGLEGLGEIPAQHVLRGVFVDPEERGQGAGLGRIDDELVDAQDAVLRAVPDAARRLVEAVAGTDGVDDEVVLGVDALPVIVEDEGEVLDLDVGAVGEDHVLERAAGDDEAVGVTEERGELDAGVVLVEVYLGL